MRSPFALTIMLFSSIIHANTLSQSLIENLHTMKSVYRTAYAPLEWKKKYANYDLDVNFQNAIDATQAKKNLNQHDVREILKNFIYAMKDYHTSIGFVTTEEAHLPLAIKGTEDRFFLVYIDRKKLPESSFPFYVGDEVVYFDNMNTLEAIQKVEAQITANVSETDRALAEIALTNRRAARGYDVPQGPITLGIKSKGSNKVSNIQLIWEYTPEYVLPRNDFKLKMSHEKRNNITLPMMNYHFDEYVDVSNPYEIGSRKTFTPDLGTKLWESSEDNTFHAYIYMNDKKKLIGYLRLSSFIEYDFNKAAHDYKDIISRFESMTDALIIDQVNNPGGSVFYLYFLASMLTDQPLQTPLHRMAITQADVLQAKKSITELQKIKNDNDARELFFHDLHGYPVSYQMVQFMLSYHRMIISEWEAGHKLTRPYWIAGVNQINPASIHYTRPILLLTNHLDFSGGDFFPAILKDNRRVTILGTRTAGAGGYVNSVQIPNNIGIDYFSITESIAERVDGNPIENLGVTPDIVYEMSATDYQTNFKPYATKIKMTIDSLTN